MSGRGRTHQENSRLRNTAGQGRSDEQIAKALDREVKAVTAHRLLLGVERSGGHRLHTTSMASAADVGAHRLTINVLADCPRTEDTQAEVQHLGTVVDFNAALALIEHYEDAGSVARHIVRQMLADPNAEAYWRSIAAACHELFTADLQ